MQAERISSKADALDFIVGQYRGKSIPMNSGRIFLIPTLKDLAKKFDITNAEIIERHKEIEE